MSPLSKEDIAANVRKEGRKRRREDASGGKRLSFDSRSDFPEEQHPYIEHDALEQYKKDELFLSTIIAVTFPHETGPPRELVS